MSKINVNTVDTQCGSTLTLGSSGKTVTLASGASQSGFGRTGTVDWCTTAKTSPFTSVSGKGYFVNTTSGAVTVTLPASPSAGDIIAVADYANTWQTNGLVLCRNSSKINGGCFNADLTTEGASVTMVYVDATKGWKQVNDATLDVSGTPSFILATGGTITTDGDFKIHTFNSDANFVVCSAPTPANNKVSYLVVAGGGASGQDQAGGGGAGGYREGKLSTDPYSASPLAATPCSSLPVTAGTTYPISVGAGGAGAVYPNPVNPGSNSVFSTITSAGGGGGGSQGPAPGLVGKAGGSGGGGSESATNDPNAGGSGNSPPVSPPQGNNGGASNNAVYGGGGGGAAEAGNTDGGGFGGDGVASSINGSPVTRAGGGGAPAGPGNNAKPGGDGGGGTGAYPAASGTPTVIGAANTGGGAGAGNGYFGACYSPGSNGGSGVVIIRYKFQ